MSKPVILVVDDEPDLLELVSLTLSRMNLESVTAASLGAARDSLKSRRFDLCLTDMRLPDGDGLDFVSYLQLHHPSLPVAVITAHGNVELAVRALKLGAFDFVSKPLDLSILRKLVSTAIKLSNPPATATPANTESQSSARLIGESAPMRVLRDLIKRVGRSQAPVYISGESGTGKELVARLIHESGARASGPFVPVNCGAIPGELMESELFGHKKGSFTGAVADKKGLIQSAEGGSLFLDEVADLPLHMQVKLLRVIQEKTLRAVGETQEVAVDVRVLSATHRNLAELVAQRGQSRQPPEPVRLETSVRCLGTLLGQHAQEISRSVKDAMDQDGVALHFVEDQIVVDDENSIAKRRELGIVGNTTDEGVGLQRLQTGFDVIEHFSRGP